MSWTDAHGALFVRKWNSTLANLNAALVEEQEAHQLILTDDVKQVWDLTREKWIRDAQIVPFTAELAGKWDRLLKGTARIIIDAGVPAEANAAGFAIAEYLTRPTAEVTAFIDGVDQLYATINLQASRGSDDFKARWAAQYARWKVDRKRYDDEWIKNHPGDYELAQQYKAIGQQFFDELNGAVKAKGETPLKAPIQTEKAFPWHTLGLVGGVLLLLAFGVRQLFGSAPARALRGR